VKEGPSDLPAVVREIATALLEGDWTRYADGSGKHFYYVVRERDRSIELRGEPFNDTLGFEQAQPDAFEDWYIRAALAEEPPDRLAKARKRVASAGVDPQLFDAVIEASRSANSQAELGKVLDEWQSKFVTDRFDALYAVLEALRIDRVKREQIFVSEVDRPDIRRALDARFLQELVERYPKAVKRATAFDWLSFSDPQVREASRCYLYGFFRAAVLSAAAAVESRLKRIALLERFESYDILVDSVFGPNGVMEHDHARATALKDLFKFRNRVAHDGKEPLSNEAARLLLLVRETFETLARRLDEIQ
jgi:hypothetical protein